MLSTSGRHATIYELMDQYQTTDQSRRVATLILANGVFGRPMVGPAGIPADRVKLLRDGFVNAVKDPELKAEAEKRNHELDPVAGEDMEKLAKEVISQPQPAVVRNYSSVYPSKLYRNDAHAPLQFTGRNYFSGVLISETLTSKDRVLPAIG
jgi:hypothetical protein